MFVACENRAGGGNNSDAKIPPTDVPHLTQFRMLFCSHRHPTASREWRHKWRGSDSWFWKLSLKEMVKKKKNITETIVYLQKAHCLWRGAITRQSSEGYCIQTVKLRDCQQLELRGGRLSDLPIGSDKLAWRWYQKHLQVVNLLNKERVEKQIGFVTPHNLKKNYFTNRSKKSFKILILLWECLVHKVAIKALCFSSSTGPPVLNLKTAMSVIYIIWNGTPSESQTALLFDLEEKVLLWIKMTPGQML